MCNLHALLISLTAPDFVETATDTFQRTFEDEDIAKNYLLVPNARMA